MFVRTKKIGKNTYAYLVINRWKNGKTSQDSKHYLGRVFTFPIKKEIDFNTFIDYNIKKESFSKVVKDLIAWELAQHGFVKKDNIWKKQKVEVSLTPLTITFRKRPCALSFHDGFLAYKTLIRISRFKFRGDDLDAYHFAKAFVESGIKVPENVFIALFDKLKRK